MLKVQVSQSRDGNCQCGSVCFKVPIDPLTYYACHCTDCRVQSASAFGLSYLIRPQDFVLVSGRLKTRTTLLASGLSKVAVFCPECGTRIYHALSDESLPISVKAGTLSGVNNIAPIANIWVASALSWVVPVSVGLPSYQMQPDEDVLIALWQDRETQTKLGFCPETTGSRGSAT